MRNAIRGRTDRGRRGDPAFAASLERHAAAVTRAAPGPEPEDGDPRLDFKPSWCVSVERSTSLPLAAITASLNPSAPGVGRAGIVTTTPGGTGDISI